MISFQSLASIDCLGPKPVKGFDSEAHDFECELDQILDAGQERKIVQASLLATRIMRAITISQRRIFRSCHVRYR